MFTRLKKRVLPPNDVKPRSVGLIFGMATSIPVICGLMLILPFAFLAGMDIGSVTVSYFSDAIGALSPIILLLVSYWLMYWYIYSVCVPINECVEHGESLAYICLFAICSIFSGSWLPAFTAGYGIVIYPVERIATTLLRLHPSLGLPRHLALGWIPGDHPQVVYH